MKVETEALIANSVGPKTTYAAAGFAVLLDWLKSFDLASAVSVLVALAVGAATIYYKHKASQRQSADLELHKKADQRAQELHEMHLKMLAAGMPPAELERYHGEGDHPTPLVTVDSEPVPLDAQERIRV